MPESGRYIYDVERKYARRTDTDSIHRPDADDQEESVSRAKNDLTKGTFKQFQLECLRTYLFDGRRNWVILLGTSMCWLLLDVVSCHAAACEARDTNLFVGILWPGFQ
jgi:hypothetical protein